MRPPPSIIGSVLDTRWLRDTLRRRLTFAVLAIIFSVLSLFPRHYVAKAELLPQQEGGGLSAALSQSGGSGLLNIGALVGSHVSIESELTISRSEAVLRGVIRKLKLVGRYGYPNMQTAELKVRKSVDIAAIRGSILQIEVQQRDPEFARSLAEAFASEIQNRLATFSLEQAAQRKIVAQNRMSDATLRLVQSQDALNRFRSENKLALPTAQLSAAVTDLATLQARLQAKQVELSTLGQFATPQNVSVKADQAEIASLRSQIAVVQGGSTDAAGGNPTRLAQKDSEYYNLYRDERFSEVLYEIYTRYLEQVTVDELSARNNLDLVEPAYVDPSRQFNSWAVGALALIVLLLAIAEFYVVRPPVGRPARVVG